MSQRPDKTSQLVGFFKGFNVSKAIGSYFQPLRHRVKRLADAVGLSELWSRVRPRVGWISPILPLAANEKVVPMCTSRSMKLFYGTIVVNGPIDDDRTVFTKLREAYFNNCGWFSRCLMKCWVWDLNKIWCSNVFIPFQTTLTNMVFSLLSYAKGSTMKILNSLLITRSKMFSMPLSHVHILSTFLIQTTLPKNAKPISGIRYQCKTLSLRMHTHQLKLKGFSSVMRFSAVVSLSLYYLL
jgi:hypothetical protein